MVRDRLVGSAAAEGDLLTSDLDDAAIGCPPLHRDGFDRRTWPLTAHLAPLQPPASSGVSGLECAAVPRVRMEDQQGATVFDPAPDPATGQHPGGHHHL